jgi:hypothetical protein
VKANKKIEILEARIETLEGQFAELRQIFGLPGTDVTDLLNAIDLMIECRDTSALDDFLKRGGKIPAIAGREANHV